MVGTSVRDRKYEVSIANTTDIASGTKSDLADPVMKTTGTNTMQMQMVDTNAGVAISLAPSTMPTASAIPPSVITLSVCPSHERMTMETRIESGIETSTISVLRQLPRNK